MTISWHDVEHDGDLFRAAVTYELDGRSWTQRFSAAILDDDAGLTFDPWLDPNRKWVRFVTVAQRAV